MSTHHVEKEKKWLSANIFYAMAEQSSNCRFGLSTLLPMIAEQAATLMGTTYSGLLLMQLDDPLMRLVAGEMPFASEFGTVFDVEKGFIGEVYRTKRPFTVQNYDEWNTHPALASHRPTGRMLGVPVRSGQICIGILTVQDEVIGLFPDEAVDDLAIFAAQTAVLIENAQLHERLQQNQERLQHFITAAPDAIIICDESQKIVQVNTAACALFGYHEKALLSQNVEILLPQERRDAHAAYIRRFAEDHKDARLMQSVRGQAYGLTANGRLIPIETTISKTIIADAPYYTAIIRDVRERLQMEREMQHTQKMESLGLVASGVAHDFNNLLNAISAQNELAKFKLPADSPARPHLQHSGNIIYQAAAITEQLLTYAGNEQYKTAPLLLNDLLRENVAFLDASLPSSIQLQMDLTTASTQIEAEAGQIQQVVMNLIINAADAYSDKHGLITIKTDRIYLDGSHQFPHMQQPLDAGMYVSLEVMDAGDGIPADIHHKIFDPFFTTKPTGRGLGLAAVRGIIRGHGGHIWFDSSSNGTTFHLLFPAGKEGKIRVDEKGERPFTDNTPPCILLVEDEETVREAMTEFLEMSGFMVVTAENGRSAIDIYQEQPSLFSLAILDLNLPVLHGRHVLEHIRRTNPELPVILLSGYNQQTALEGIGDLDHCIFIKKPFNIRQLVEKTRELLGV